MPSRTQITLEPDLDRRAKEKAGEMGISFAEYVRRLIRRDLAGTAPKPDLRNLVGIGNSGGSDIARYKDEYIAEAIEKDFERIR
jgi:predicted DNA-binding protein